MSITVQDLYNLVTTMEVDLVAGHGGMQRRVRWTHSVENLRIVEFLMGRELVFITGMNLGEQIPLLTLIQEIYQKQISGIILNLGPYIKAVPAEVIQFADDHNLPLFTAPWHVHMAELNRTFCIYITQNEQDELDNQVTFRNAMLCTTADNNYTELLIQRGFSPQWYYQVTVIESDNQMQLFRQLKQRLECAIPRNILFEYDGKLYLILYCDDKQESSENLEKVATMVAEWDFQAKLSCGTWTTLNSLNQSYSIASKIARLERGDTGLLSYQSLGPYRLVLNISDATVLREYVEETIGPLLKYSEINPEQELFPILRRYLDCNGSVLQTAEKFFIHRNTVNYKLKKIEQILGISLAGAETRLDLQLAIFAHFIVLQHKEV